MYHTDPAMPQVIVRSPDLETQIIERLVRMETKLDYVNDQFRSHEDRLKALEKNTPDPDHESRLRKLERAIWIATGAASAGGGVAGAVITHLSGG